MVPNLYTSHVIALTDQLAYIAISTIGETKDSVTITILQVTIAPEAYADGVIDESSLEIKRLHVFSSVSHIISVSYEPLIGAAAILCDLCCIFINFRINDSIIVQQSVVLGTDVTRMQKITMIPISCNHDMRVYAFCVDSTLRIFTVAFVHHLNGPFDIVSVRLHGAWSPIDGLKAQLLQMTSCGALFHPHHPQSGRLGRKWRPGYMGYCQLPTFRSSSLDCHSI